MNPDRERGEHWWQRLSPKRSGHERALGAGFSDHAGDSDDGGMGKRELQRLLAVAHRNLQAIDPLL